MQAPGKSLRTFEFPTYNSLNKPHPYDMGY